MRFADAAAAAIFHPVAIVMCRAAHLCEIHTHMSARSIILIAVGLTLIGCSGKSNKNRGDDSGGDQPMRPGTPSEENRATSPTEPDEPAQTSPEPTSPSPATTEPRSTRAGYSEQVRAEVKTAVASWVAAQTKGDAAAYHALYHGKHFTGIRRTHDGQIKRFDAQGWKRDRNKMFQLGTLAVAADDLTVETWLKPGSTLKPGVSIARFVQRWRGGKYADHGIKVLHWWRDGQGVQRIIYEDLLNSEPGWDRTPAGDVQLLKVSVPMNAERARAMWEVLAPTGANYADKLASIPPGPVAEAMARVLIEDGELECNEIVEFMGCVNDFTEWKTLDPTATFEDPCLRRRLALWGLPHLSPQSLDDLSAELEEMVALTEPDNALPKAVLEAVARASEATRLTVMLAAGELLAENPLLDGLSDAALLRLYVEVTLDQVFDKLSPRKHRSLFIEALDVEDLQPRTRISIIKKLAKVRDPALTETLVAMAAGEHCGLAMAAALALASRGDSSHMPKKPGNQDLEAHARALCMLVHDPDKTRQTSHWRAFLPPKGNVPVTFLALWGVEDDHEEEDADEDADSDGDDDGAKVVGRLTRATSTMADLETDFDLEVPECDASDDGGSCGASVPRGTYTVSFTRAADGTLYISKLDMTESSDLDC